MVAGILELIPGPGLPCSQVIIAGARILGTGPSYIGSPPAQSQEHHSFLAYLQTKKDALY